jgi:glycerol-3-phosphate dehydrogenase
VLPWKGRTLVGTSESRELREPDDQGARRDELDRFLEEIQGTFPALGLEPDEVTLVHRGIVPAALANGHLSLLGRSRIIDHAREGGPADLVSIVGVKYTTARAVAEKAVDLILRKLGRMPAPCRTADTLLPEAGMDDRDPSDPIACAVGEEMAQTLTDVVVRRTGLGVLGYPGDAAANATAERMRQLLGWSDERVRTERAALRDFYKIS